MEETASSLYSDPIVTQLLPATIFYEAKVYHQNYYNSRRTAPYCTAVIDPKISKLRAKYANKLKSEYVNET